MVNFSLLGLRSVSSLCWYDLDDDGKPIELLMHVLGPSNWHRNYPTCAGGSQSPVNIDRSKVAFSGSLTTFDIPGYETIPRGAHWQLHNNGRTGEI